MALSGIPIDPQQCIGDSLVVLNDSFIELDSRTLNLSSDLSTLNTNLSSLTVVVGASSGNLYTTIQDVSSSLYTTIQSTSSSGLTTIQQISSSLYTTIQSTSSTQTVPVKFSYTGNNSLSSFALTGTNLSVSPISYRVTINGVVQDPGVDFNITGSNLVFTSVPPSGVKIVVVTAENYANNTFTNNLTSNNITVIGTVSASGQIYSQGGVIKPLSGVGGIVVNNNSTNVTVISADGGSVGSGITLMTEVTATGSTSSLEILNIPSSVKRITVTFTNLSLPTGDSALLCLGTAGGFVTTGYQSFRYNPVSIVVTQVGFFISYNNNNGTNGMSTLCKSISNKWFNFGTAFSATMGLHTFSGSLSSFTGQLDRLQIKSSSGGLITSGIFGVSYEF